MILIILSIKTMCRICDSNYEYDDYEIEFGIYLEIKDCNNITNIPNIDINGLKIINCNNLTEISNIKHLEELHIINCDKIIEIPNLTSLSHLTVEKLPKLIQIYPMENLEKLCIIDCPKLIQFMHKKPNLGNCSLISLTIKDCLHLRNIYTDDISKMKQYITIMTITKWYKYNYKTKILWKIAEYFSAKKYSPKNVLKYINLK